MNKIVNRFEKLSQFCFRKHWIFVVALPPKIIKTSICADKHIFKLFFINDTINIRKTSFLVIVMCNPGKNTGVVSHFLYRGIIPWIEPGFPALQADSLLSEPSGKASKQF